MPLALPKLNAVEVDRKLDDGLRCRFVRYCGDTQQRFVGVMLEGSPEFALLHVGYGDEDEKHGRAVLRQIQVFLSGAACAGPVG